MENRWSDDNAARFVGKYAERWGQDLAIGLYAASLIGAEERLVLHGGGNSSVKTSHTNLLGERLDAIYVKASGYNMAHILLHAGNSILLFLIVSRLGGRARVALLSALIFAVLPAVAVAGISHQRAGASC